MQENYGIKNETWPASVQPLPCMEAAGLEVAPGESVSERVSDREAESTTSTAVDFVNTVHLGYAEFI